MDILYTVKNKSINEELRYSLRSLENLPHNRVFIVGGCPSFINKKNIIYIPTPTLTTKYLTTTNNLKIACNNPDLSENFILMNDDFFILKQIYNPVKELNLNFGTIKNLAEAYRKQYGHHTKYSLGMIDAINILKQRFGIDNPLSFELHTPIVLNKKKYLRMIELLKDVHTNGLYMHKRSLYYNIFGLSKGSKTIKDVKIYKNSNVKYSEFDKMTLLSDTDLTWLTKVSPYVMRKFPEKSKYEL